MSERTYHSLWPQDGPSLQPTTINLRTYTGEPIRVKGSISLSVVHNRYIQEDDKKEIKRLCVGTVKHKVN